MKKKNMYLTECIEEIDNLTCSHPASVNIDVANYYYTLTKMIRPLLVVEIGCFIGFSTLHFAQAIDEQGFGKIISIDAFNWEVDAGQGKENRYDVAMRYRKKAGLENVIHYIKGFSTEVFPQIEKDISGKIDILYIDGDHTVPGVFKDFNTYYNDVREGGFILLHDIYPEMCGEEGPRFLIDHLKRKRLIPKTLELLELPTRDGFGVSVLRKVSSRPLQLQVPFTVRLKSLYLRGMNRFGPDALKLRKNEIVSSYKGIELKVIDDHDGTPITGARIACHQRWNEKRVTGKDGTTTLSHYLPNRYQFEISAPGYITATDVLLDVVVHDELQRFTIALQKQTPQPKSSQGEEHPN